MFAVKNNRTELTVNIPVVPKGVSSISLTVNLNGVPAETVDRPDAGRICFVFGSRLLHKCLRELNQQPEEAALYVTGMRIGRTVFMESTAAFRYEVQQMTYLKAETESSREALEDFSRYGYLLHAHLHIHPGSGAGMTMPSRTDRSYQARLERGGYDCIGGIFSRDGYLRFFSDNLSFRAKVFGKQIEARNGRLYRLCDV